MADLETMPAAVHQETVILGAILLDSNVFADVREKLRCEDFSLDSNRRVFAAMERLANQDRVIDLETLPNELRRTKELAAVGGMAYLFSLTEGLPRRPVIDEYMRIVRDKTILRAIVAISSEASSRAYEQTDSALEVAAWTGSAIESLIDTGIGATEADASAASGTIPALAEFDRRRQLEKDDALPYGMTVSLDDLTGGMFPGEITVIGGESGVGKSSAMIQSLIWAGKRGVPAVAYSLEMTRQQLLGRMWSIVSGVPYRCVRWPRTATPEQMAELRSAAYRIGEWPLHIYDRATMSLGEICASVKVHISRRGAKLLCVDYLQRISVPGQKEVRLQMSQAAMKLSQAVKGTPAHMLLLSQLKRREDNGYPQMRDLRESGQIENEAHTILLLWREYDKEKGHFLEAARILVPKNRFGFNGMLTATFNTNYAIFE